MKLFPISVNKKIRLKAILNYKRLCPLVPLFGNKCEICVSVTNV